jgi:hypothetical protein
MCPIGLKRERYDKKNTHAYEMDDDNKLFKQQKIINMPLDYGVVAFQSKSELCTDWDVVIRQML